MPKQILTNYMPLGSLDKQRYVMMVDKQATIDSLCNFGPKYGPK